MAHYSGPIVDAHHHLWAAKRGSHPWLDRPDRAVLRDKGSAADYDATFAEFDVAATVWVEALAADPEAEVVAAEAARKASGGRLCAAIVAHAPLDSPDVEARLDRLAALTPALRGVRDIVAAGPGAPPFARAPDLLSSPAFRTGLRALAARDLVFDLMLRPSQMRIAADAIAATPGLVVAIEHAGSPHDGTSAGMALWREGLARLADLPDVVVKVSALQCLAPRWSDDTLRRYLDPLVERFGPERLCVGTDWPVHDLVCPGPSALSAFLRLTDEWSFEAQRAFFHDTAQRTFTPLANATT